MLALFLLSLSGIAQAQDPAYDHVKATEAALEKPDTDLTANLGFTYASGNAVFIAVNGGVTAAHKWGQNRFTFVAGTNLNLAKIDADANGTLDDAERAKKLTWTSQRVASSARYDRFFGAKDSLYVSGGFERDALAGLLWRFNEQFGYARVLVGTDSTKVNLEAGVAYAEENFATGADADGNPIYTEILDNDYLAARVFFGASHSFNKYVSLSDNVEMFENLFTPADFRLTNALTLSTKLSDKFSINVGHQLAFDNQPVEGFQKVDQTTMLTLVASIF